MKSLLLGLLLVCAPCAQAAEIIATATANHGTVPAGHSVSQVIRFPTQGHIPLVTVLSHAESSTILYSVELTGRRSAIVRCYNYGPYPQQGSVTLAIWE